MSESLMLRNPLWAESSLNASARYSAYSREFRPCRSHLQHAADELDPEPAPLHDDVAVGVDEPRNLRYWRSSSAPKKTRGPFEDLVRAQLAGLLLELADRAASSVLTPGA